MVRMKRFISVLLVWAMGFSHSDGAWSMSLGASGAASRGVPVVPTMPAGVSGAFQGGVDPHPALGLLREIQRSGIRLDTPLTSVGQVQQLKDALTLASPQSPAHADLDEMMESMRIEDAVRARGWRFDGDESAAPGEIDSSLEEGGHHYIVADAGADLEEVRQGLHRAASKRETPNDRIEVRTVDGKAPGMIEVAPGQGKAVAEAIGYFGEQLRSVPYLIQRVGQEIAFRVRELRQASWRRLTDDLGRMGILHVHPRDFKGSAPIPIGRFAVEYRFHVDAHGDEHLSGWHLTHDGRSVENGYEADKLIGQGEFTQDDWDQAIAQVQARVDQWKGDNLQVEKQARAEMEQAPHRIVTELVGSFQEGLAKLLFPGLEEFNRRVALRQAEIGAAVLQLSEMKFGAFSAHVWIREDSSGRVYVVAFPKIGETRIETRADAEEMIKAGQITRKDYFIAKWRIEQQAEILRRMANVHATNSLQELEALQSPYADARDYVRFLARLATDHYDRWLMEGFPETLLRARALSDNGGGRGAPVIWEEDPTPKKLLDALAKAQGGFLAVQMMDLLERDGAWPALMGALRTVGTQVVLIGPPLILMVLKHHDRYFQKRFKDFPASALRAVHEGS